MADSPDPVTDGTPAATPQTPSAPEPFVYPTIGTEKVLEKGTPPSGTETRDQSAGGAAQLRDVS